MADDVREIDEKMSRPTCAGPSQHQATRKLEVPIVKLAWTALPYPPQAIPPSCDLAVSIAVKRCLVESQAGTPAELVLRKSCPMCMCGIECASSPCPHVAHTSTSISPFTIPVVHNTPDENTFAEAYLGVLGYATNLCGVNMACIPHGPHRRPLRPRNDPSILF